MDARLLTESGWKTTAQKYRIKDKDLQQALFFYETLEDDDYEFRLKSLGRIAGLAGSLKRDKDIAAQPAVAKYLADVVSAAEAAKNSVMKAKAQAAKTEAMTAKKAEAAAKQRDQTGNGEEEDEKGDYKERLLTALQKLKGAKDAAYEFAVCLREEEPRFALMVAKKITPAHKKILQEAGGKRFLNLGDPALCKCRFENGRFTFTPEKPIGGLARKLQDSIKFFTGKKYPIAVGAEAADADEETPGSRPILVKAPQVWNKTRRDLSSNIEQLKAAVRKQFAAEGPDLIKEIEHSMKKLDGLLGKFDNKLEASLEKANAAKDAEARKTELASARSLLADYINYVKSEPMIAHIDSNPFGVKTNLRQTLTGGLTRVAQAIG